MLESYRGLADLPRSLWILEGATLVNRCGAMVLSFLTLYYIKVLGATVVEAGSLTALYSLGSILSAPVATYLCRRASAWRVLTASVLASGSLFLIYPQVKSFALLIPFTVLVGCITEVARPAGYTCIGQIAADSDKRKAFALHRLAVNLGMSVGPLAGGFLAIHDYRYIFWVDGATSLAAGTVLLLSPAPSETHLTPKPPGEKGQGLPRRFVLFLVGNFVGFLVFTQNFVGVPLFAVEFAGYTEAQTGILFSCNTVMILLFETPLIHATRRWSLSRALALGNLLQGLGLGLFAVWPKMSGMVAGVLLFSVGEMLQAPLCLAYVNQSVPRENLALANSWLSGTGSVCFLIGPPLTAASLENLGGTGHWTAIALLGLLSGLWFFFLGDPKDPHEKSLR